MDENVNNTVMQVIKEIIMNNDMWIKKIDPTVEKGKQHPRLCHIKAY